MTHTKAAEIADILRSELPAMTDRLRASVAERVGPAVDPASVRATYPELHRAAWERALELAAPRSGASAASVFADHGRPEEGAPASTNGSPTAGTGLREHAVLLVSTDIIDLVVEQFRGASFADVRDEIRSLVPAVAAFDPAAAAALSAECNTERHDPAARYWSLAVPLDATVAALGKAGLDGSATRVAARRLEELSGLMRIPGAAFAAERKAASAP